MILHCLNFYKAGTYTYTVTEIPGEDEHYRYSNSVFTVVINVVANETTGALSIEKMTCKNGFDIPAAHPIFVNEFYPDGTEIELQVESVLRGNQMKTDETFTYLLIDEYHGNIEIGRDTITGSGKVKFDAITYDCDGEFTYYVSQVSAETEGMSYDKTVYTVKVKVEQDGYGYKAEAKYKDSEGKDVKNLVFTNTYAKIDYSIPVFTKVNGNAPKPETFTLELSAVGGSPMPENNTTTITGEGKSKFGEIIYTATGNYSYVVTETKGKDTTHYQYDDAEYNVVVNVAEDKNGALYIDKITVDGKDSEGPVLTNTYTPEPAEVTLNVENELRGNYPSDYETFTFVLKDSAGKTIEGIDSKINWIESVDVSFSALRFEKEGTYTYTVAEKKPETVTKGMAYDETVYTVTIVVTQDGEKLEADVTYKYGDNTSAKALKFTNTYTRVTYQIPVENIIEGDPWEYDEFSFYIEAASGVPMPEENLNKGAYSITITGAYQGHFKDITYHAAGSYTYTVYEQAGTDKHYTYDNNVYTVVVSVVANEETGALSIGSVTCTDASGKSASLPVFTNTYKPEPTKVTLAVGNVLTGNSMDSDEEFSFELKDASNKTVIETIQITGTGNQNFSALTFDKEGTYTYTVAEKKSETATKGMAYDETVYTVTIKVTRDWAKLKAEVTYKNSEENEVEELAFTNTYTRAEFTIAGYLYTVDGGEVAGEMTGLGVYYEDTEVTLTTPVVTGYNFVGWYAYDNDAENTRHYTGDNLCTSRTYKFTVTADTDLVAVYKTLGTASITINGGSKFSINGLDKSTAFTADYLLGSQVTVICNSDKFEYWENSAGTVLSRNKSYTFTVTGKESVTAVLNVVEADQATVVFESFYGQVMSRNQYAFDATLSSEPTLPFRYGYTALGWDYNGDGDYDAEEDTFEVALSAAFNTDEKLIKISPVYEPIVNTFEIMVVNGTGSKKYHYNLNDKVTVKADEPATGYKFSHWKDESDTVLSYNKTYRFFASKDMTVTAVYEEMAVKVEAKGTTAIIETSKDTTNHKLIFVSMSTVPDGCTINKAGIVATNNSEKATNLTAENADYVRGNAWSGTAYRFTWTKGKVTNGQTWYVRAYLVYTDAEGNTNTVYGAVVNQTMSN